jgi:hypothetical protein
MNIPSSITNYSENRIRKHWLLSTACFLIFYPLALFAFVYFLSTRISIPEDALIEPLAHTLVGLFSMWLIWHCAYKKHGTKLLSLWMVVSPLKMLASVVECLKEACNIWMITLFLIEISIFLWWWLLSFKMKAVNKAIQGRLSLRTAGSS